MTPRERARRRQQELSRVTTPQVIYPPRRPMEKRFSDDGTPAGWRKINLVAYANGNRIVILDGGDIKLDEIYGSHGETHNCDESGCQSCHVIARITTPTDVKIGPFPKG